MNPTDRASVRTGIRRDRRYLFVCDADRAWVVDLPDAGTIEIGRSSDCLITLVDTKVSRVHAKIAMRDGRGSIEDCASQNGTRVNGNTIRTVVELAGGDVIEIGGAALVFHGTIAPRREVDEVAFRREVEREIERTQVSRRGFAVLAIRAPGVVTTRLRELVSGTLRVFELATTDGDDVLVLVPEAGDLTELARELAAVVGVLAPAQIGYATCPRDGFEAGALIAAARGAMTELPTGQTPAPVKHRVLRAGDREIVIAEPTMIQLYALVERLAKSDLPVMLYGETGVGKEVVAAALHAWSPRARAPFVAINCAALPEQLAESELFGHERGAFSGAIAAKPGLLEAASGGTVLLDEVGDMTLATQAKLLRALETKRVARIGSVEERPIDVRLLAATHRDLEADVASGRFRRDLYYRLIGGSLAVPPLRDRPRELVVLATTFLRAACAALAREPMELSDDAMVELVGYPWPGNVRELKHVIDYLAAAHPEHTLRATHVRGRLGAAPAAARAMPQTAAVPLRSELAELERRRIVEALEASDGHQASAAAALGIPLRTFVAKLRRYAVRRK